MGRRYALGLDFGTASGRAVVVDVADGTVVGSATTAYRSGVIDVALPIDGPEVRLSPDWALQDPADYRQVLATAIPEALAAAGVQPVDIVGVGIDATACTVLLTTADGTPLCDMPSWRSEPHAWPKLWKHHAAEHQAERIDAALEAYDPGRLARYGGSTSAEWLFAKLLQTLDDAPAVVDAADRCLELGDWLGWQLTGSETRGATAAGYKAMWSATDGYPTAVLDALHPDLGAAADRLLSDAVRPIGERAGRVTASAASITGLREGTPVSVAGVDAHVAAPAVDVTEPGRLVLIMGTSTCHLWLDERMVPIPGVGGAVPDGIVPGLVGYEAGQAAVGDLLAWFVDQAVPPWIHEAAARSGMDIHLYLQREWADVAPGATGLVALDWWNGNRSILADGELSGVIAGLTLTTSPADVYRALVEATAFGTRTIVDAIRGAGMAIDDVVACGGLADRSPAIVQLYADVLDRPIHLASGTGASAVGAAILGSVAAGREGGGHDTIQAAARAMAAHPSTVIRPDPARVAANDVLFRVYRELHDHFGRGGSDALRELRRLRTPG